METAIAYEVFYFLKVYIFEDLLILNVLYIANMTFKGYLCHKMITSQNVPSKAQIKNFFIL